MPYCWRVKLFFACGCVQETRTAHSCDNNHTSSTGCSSVWTHNRSTRKKCADHRDSSLEGAGITGDGAHRDAGEEEGEEVEISVEGPGL